MKGNAHKKRTASGDWLVEEVKVRSLGDVEEIRLALLAEKAANQIQ